MGLSRSDGRIRRAAASREKLLAAGLKFIEAGQWRPTPEQIAARADLSVRTFFHQYHTMQEYREALLAHHAASIRAVANLLTSDDIVKALVIGRVI